MCVWWGRLGVVGLKLPFRLHNRYRGKANRHPLIIRYWPAMFSSSPWSLQGIKGVECRSTCPFTARYRSVYITIKPLDCARDNLHLRLNSLPAQYILRIAISFVINCKTFRLFEESCCKVNFMNCDAKKYFPQVSVSLGYLSPVWLVHLITSSHTCWTIDKATGRSPKNAQSDW